MVTAALGVALYGSFEQAEAVDATMMVTAQGGYIAGRLHVCVVVSSFESLLVGLSPSECSHAILVVCLLQHVRSS